MQILTIPCWSGILPLMNQAKKNKENSETLPEKSPFQL